MKLDPQEFRRALGAFATGVTIITTRAENGAPLGLTVNSFNSVSLNPPMVLWSLAQTALSLPAFRSAKHWAVPVLAADQDDLSSRFARRGADKFDGLALDEGIGALPLLRGCAARFQCTTAFQYEGGDHVILVGQVQSFDRTDAPPLVFHSGSYAHAARRDEDDRPIGTEIVGSFDADFLGYLLGRSHFRFYSRIRPHLAQENLIDEEFSILSALTLRGAMRAQEFEAMKSVLGERVVAGVQSLVQRGFVCESAGPEYDLTDSGRGTALRLISAAKAMESQVIEEFGAGDVAALKTLLRRVLLRLAPKENRRVD